MIPSLGLKNLWEVLLGQAPEVGLQLCLPRHGADARPDVCQPADAGGPAAVPHCAHQQRFPGRLSGRCGARHQRPRPECRHFRASISQGSSRRSIIRLPSTQAKAGSSVPVKFSLGGNKGLNASATFTDPGTLDTHTAVWDWGDGSLPRTVTETNGQVRSPAAIVTLQSASTNSP